LRTVGGPALIFGDVIAGDELRGQEVDGRGGVFSVWENDPPPYGPPRPRERSLRGGGPGLRRWGGPWRGPRVGRAIDRGDDDSGTLLLARRQISADRLRIVDGEDGVDLGEAGQIALRDCQAPLTRSLAVLVARENLDAGILGEDVLAARHTVDHGGDLRAILDDHVAFAAELVDDVLAG